MIYTKEMIAIVREMHRRRPAVECGAKELIEDAARRLRAPFYPKQRAFFTSREKQRATRKTRRAGATSGGCREMIARAIETPGFRGLYAGATRSEVIKRSWKNDTKSGFLDILEALASAEEHRSLVCYKLGGVTIEVRRTDLELEFSNGAQIQLFGADDEKSRAKLRGQAKHVVWIDEAQDFPGLEDFIDSVIEAGLADFGGEVWLTGTPGKDCAGRFYDVTKDPDSDDGVPLAGWEVHEFAQVDNPFFGRVEGRSVIDNLSKVHGPYGTVEEAEREAVRVRWERTAGEGMRKSGKTIDDPDVQREYFGKWVRTDARYVYPVHLRTKSDLLFAPLRLIDNPINAEHPPWYDHVAAVEDLPKQPNGMPYEWFFALGADFGYSPDPFALVVWAFCYELGGIYEMFSWKSTKIDTDDQGRYMRMLWDACGRVVSFVGDPAGKQDDFRVWQTRLGLPIEEANKRGKNTLEAFLADDITKGVVFLRDDSPLYLEMRNLVYLKALPGEPRIVHKNRVVAGVRHGDHCCDAARYSYEDLSHFVLQLRSDPRPKKTDEDRAEEALDFAPREDEYAWLR